MPPVRALPMLSMSAINNASPIQRNASPSKLLSTPSSSASSSTSYRTGSTTSSAKGHARARSSSGSSNTSGSTHSGSRAVPAFPVLSATPESVLEQNASDILWKTFVAFEQDARDAP